MKYDLLRIADRLDDASWTLNSSMLSDLANELRDLAERIEEATS